MIKTLKSAYRELNRIIRYGPAYLWCRYIGPASILHRPAIYTDLAGDVTVCVLTCHKDWLVCLWSLVSFYELSGLRMPLLIYNDGTLLERDERHLAGVFPHAWIVSSTAGEAAVKSALSAYPNCMRFRDTQPYARKIIDLPIVSPSPFILVLDSDLFFMKRPEELIKHLESIQPGRFVFERDCQYAYFATRESITEIFNVDIASQANTGILLADVSGFDYSKLERWLAQPGVQNHAWAEQTLWAMYAGRERTEFLGKEYDVTMSPDIESSTVAKHYIRPLRDFMYVEGIPYLKSLFEARETLKG